MDGTLVPVRDWSIAASSRNYQFSANVQVIIDADTRLVGASACPALGNRADAHVWRASGLPERCENAVVLGDGAYIRPGRSAPQTPGRALLPGEEADNAGYRRVRARVEQPSPA